MKNDQKADEKKKIKKENINTLNPFKIRIINEQIRPAETQTTIYS
jgi:hypothetical protein